MATTDGSFVAVREAAVLVERSLSPILENLRCLSALRPSEAAGVAAVFMCVLNFATDAVHRLGDPGAATIDAPDELRSLVAAVISASNPDGEDVWFTVFGVPSESLIDARGYYSPSRLLGCYHGWYDDLMQRLRRLSAPVSPAELELTTAARYAPAILAAESPLEVLRVSRAVHRLITTKFSSDAARTGRILREMLLGVDRSYTNHMGVTGIRRSLELVQSARERAVSQLDLYRRGVEGQLRPWGWVVLQLLTDAHGPEPRLAQLRERLVSTNHDLALAAATLINTEWRNAAATRTTDGTLGPRRCASVTLSLPRTYWII